MIILKMFIEFICFVFLCLKLPAMIIWFGHFVVFIRWKLIDLRKELKLKKKGVVVFRPFGLKMFCGRQGAGKTMAMVWYLDNLRRKYPNAENNHSILFTGVYPCCKTTPGTML